MANGQISAERVAQLVEAASSVAGAAELKGTLAAVVEAAIDLTGARYGALGVLGSHGFLSEFIHRGMDSDTAKRIGAPPTGHGLLGTITREQRCVRLDNLADHADSVGFPDHHPPMSSFLGVPIRVGEDVFGNLYLTDKDGGFTDEDVELIEALATISGSAIATARLQNRLRTVAVVEDRERIARDLHDAIIQDLFAVGLGLQAAAKQVQDEEVGVELRESAARLDDSITALRRFIFDLRPPVWAQRRIRAELDELVHGLAEPHDVVVETLYRGEVDTLPDRLIDELLLMAGESVSNALRHAESAQITVRLNRHSDHLELVTMDDGVGFRPEAVDVGMGLINLRSRAADLGGHAEIISTEGGGTTVEVTLPL